ncbi:MAG: acyl-ACP thioesterase [Clostridiales bacterium]|nr:acyl-ACP thioesterase [Clostridiales bacterium]
MIKPYTKNYEVHYYEINRHSEATPVSLINFLEDIAISHSRSVGLGLDKLKEDGLGWVLNGWYISFLKPAHLFDNLIVETWPSNFERFHATREFYIKSENGEILARATSLWIMVNIEKGRPTRIPVYFGEAYGMNPVRAVDHTFDKMDVPNEFEVEKQFHIRKSDIDTNIHVNNKKYLDWMLELVPESIYDNFSLSALQISYLKGAYYGSAISSGLNTLRQDALAYEYQHSIKDNTGNATHAAGRTMWIPRTMSI